MAWLISIQRWISFNVNSDGSSINYTYQGHDLYQISRKGMTHTYQERDLEGHPTKILILGNLGTVTLERDPLSRWKKITSPFYSAYFPDHAYDPAGNLLEYHYSDALGKKEEHYTYDELNQLTKEDTLWNESGVVQPFPMRAE